MLLEKNHFHFVGIGGIGMSALAKFLLSKEKHVTGSDVHDSEMVQDLNKKGIQVNIGHDKSHVLDGVEVVIYSSAVPSTNPERTTARERGIPEVSYAQFLGEVSKTFSTIVVTNIEEDHLDYYRDINHIRDTFQIFADKLIGKGMMILNADDAESMKLKVERPITYWMQRTEKAERAERNSYVALNRATTKG